MTPPAWRRDDEHHTWNIETRDVWIWIAARPHYCDRGRWLAHVEPKKRLGPPFDLDAADGWPRYYFDLERAKAEIEAWLRRRGQLP